MSAGLFTDTIYQATYDTDIGHPIRVQPETLLLTIGGVANSGVVPVTTSPISARVNSSKRSLGLNARVLRLKLTGTPPANYSATSIVTVPIMSDSNFRTWNVKNTVATYLGTSWKVIGGTAETVK